VVETPQYGPTIFKVHFGNLTLKAKGRNDGARFSPQRGIIRVNGSECNKYEPNHDRTVRTA
jgi:hypothetical protein